MPEISFLRTWDLFVLTTTSLLSVSVSNFSRLM